MQRKRREGLIRAFSWYCSGMLSFMTEEKLAQYPTACNYMQFINLPFSPITLYSVINAIPLYNYWNRWLFELSKAKVIVSNLVLWKNQSWHSYISWLKKKRKKWVLKDIQPIPEALCLLLSIFIFIKWKVQEGQMREGTDRQSVLDSFKKDQQYL